MVACPFLSTGEVVARLNCNEFSAVVLSSMTQAQLPSIEEDEASLVAIEEAVRAAPAVRAVACESPASIDSDAARRCVDLGTRAIDTMLERAKRR